MRRRPPSPAEHAADLGALGRGQQGMWQSAVTEHRRRRAGPALNKADAAEARGTPRRLAAMSAINEIGLLELVPSPPFHRADRRAKIDRRFALSAELDRRLGGLVCWQLAGRRSAISSAMNRSPISRRAAAKIGAAPAMHPGRRCRHLNQSRRPRPGGVGLDIVGRWR